MNDLQWILILVGIVVVLGIYLYSRFPGRPRHRPASDRYAEQGESDPWDELLSDEGLETSSPSAWAHEPPAESPPKPQDAAPEPEPEYQKAAAESVLDEESTHEAAQAPAAGIRMHTPPPGEEKLIVLHVAAEHWLDGESVHEALRANRLLFGPRRIYHRIEEVQGVPESVFCVANMLKPGYLDPAESGDLRTRGLSLFMVLPGPMEGLRAYRDMLDTAGALAEQLDAAVLDEKKTRLNKQMIQYIQDEIVQFERRRASHA